MNYHINCMKVKFKEPSYR